MLDFCAEVPFLKMIVITGKWAAYPTSWSVLKFQRDRDQLMRDCLDFVPGAPFRRVRQKWVVGPIDKMTTDISVVRGGWDPTLQQEIVDEYEYDGGNSSSRLFERSRIKALAGTCPFTLYSLTLPWLVCLAQWGLRQVPFSPQQSHACEALRDTTLYTNGDSMARTVTDSKAPLYQKLFKLLKKVKCLKITLN